jgi:hypothetical protein
MQLNSEEYKQLYRLVDVALKEALWDYSYSGDMSVVNINGQPLIFNKAQLSMLTEVKEQIEKEM